MNNSIVYIYLSRFLIVICAYLFLISPGNILNSWQKIQTKGYLTWVTRPSPLTYYNSLDGIIGLEYDILKQFCDENNLELNVVKAGSNKALFALFDSDSVDVIGANLTLTDYRSNKYLASIGYDETFISLISSYRKPKIKSLGLLKNYQGIVLSNSSYEVRAEALTKNYDAEIEVLENKSLFELLQMVTAGDVDYTLADSNIITIFKAYVPKLRIGEKLSDTSEIVFYTKKVKDGSLKATLDSFIAEYKKQNKVSLYKKYLIDTLPNSNPADTVYFLKNYKKRWQSVKPIIYSTAEKYSIKPILLGAISYQESHWNARAVSPTLVKGLMMLTKAVAKEQGVTDRFNPLQSLEGGARHLLKTMEKIPERIKGLDRTNFALAAYNIGYGHLEKARVMAQKAGKNPDLWSDVKLYLPELNNLKIGKADGKTAVRYVENIHIYQNLLQWKEQQ